MYWSIPYLLIYLRLLLALIIGLLSFSDMIYSNALIVSFMLIGVLSDVFDGIIARMQGISTERLRIWDSNVDQVFWVVTIFAVFFRNWPFISSNLWPILVLVFLELLAYIVSFIKFKRTVATHSILAKIWTLFMLLFLIDLTVTGTSNLTFWMCIVLGIISRIEIVVILVMLKKWATDVPTVFVVNKINKGLPFRKFKLFNA